MKKLIFSLLVALALGALIGCTSSGDAVDRTSLHED